MSGELFPSDSLLDRSSRELARARDPLTSHEAAEHLIDSGKLGRMMWVALDVVKWHPGLTAAELEHYSGVSDGRIRKRLNDLRAKGLARTGPARKCSVTGRNAQTWEAT